MGRTLIRAVLGDDKLDWLLGRLRGIKHIEFIRIGTKMPTVTPQRITKNLVNILKKHHPLWMSLHFTHPSELTPELTEATARLADAGIPLGSQTVLLKGVNDDLATLKKLFHELLKIREAPIGRVCRRDRLTSLAGRSGHVYGHCH